MRALILCALLITALPFATALPAQHVAYGPSAEFEAQAIREVRQRFEELAVAAKTLDVKLYMRFFDPRRFSGLNADGTTIASLADFEAQYRELTSQIESYVSLEFPKVRLTFVDERTVVLVNEYEATVLLVAGTEVAGSGAGAQVWSKSTGEWLLVSVSSSVRH